MDQRPTKILQEIIGPLGDGDTTNAYWIHTSAPLGEQNY